MLRLIRFVIIYRPRSFIGYAFLVAALFIIPMLLNMALGWAYRMLSFSTVIAYVMQHHQVQQVTTFIASALQGGIVAAL